MIHIGIDPGLSGAVAILNNGDYQVYDTPIAQVGTKQQYLTSEMALLLKHIRPTYVHAWVEQVHSMPHQGVSSTFSLGYGLGLWIGILSTVGIPYTLVAPQRWRKDMLADMAKDKDAGRLRAQQLFPLLAGELSLKKHHGRADALLLSEWGRRQDQIKVNL